MKILKAVLNSPFIGLQFDILFVMVFEIWKLTKFLQYPKFLFSIFFFMENICLLGGHITYNISEHARSSFMGLFELQDFGQDFKMATLVQRCPGYCSLAGVKSCKLVLGGKAYVCALSSDFSISKTPCGCGEIDEKVPKVPYFAKNLDASSRGHLTEIFSSKWKNG